MEAPGDRDRRSRRGAPTLFTAETERSRQSPRGKEAGSTLPLSLPLALRGILFFFFPLSASALLCTEQSCVRLESFHTN